MNTAINNFVRVGNEPLSAGNYTLTTAGTGRWRVVNETSGCDSITIGDNYGTGGYDTSDWTIGHHHCVDYWNPWPVYPNYPYSPNYIIEQEDKGKKAIEMADMLIKKKLVDVKSAKQLMCLLDELMKII